MDASATKEMKQQDVGPSGHTDDKERQRRLATALEDPQRESPPVDRDVEIVAVVRLRDPWRRAAYLGASLAIVAGLVLRFWTRSPLWLDEALTVDISKLPIHAIPAALKRDGAPPLYYYLLHFWMGIFGTSNLGVRSLSGVISVATLPVAWIGARNYAGKRAAWIVLLLVATAPFAVYYATEARMYSLVMLLTACGIVAVENCVKKPRPRNVVGLAVVTSALLYSQYWALYLIGALGLWLIVRIWRSESLQRRNATVALGAVIVGCLTFVPWLPIFIFQARHTGTPWAKPPNFAAIINAITGFTDNQATLLTTGSDQGRLLALFYFGLGALGLFGVAVNRFHIDLDIRTRRAGRPMAFIVGVTLIAAITGGIITGSAFSSRYASVVFIPLLILIAVGALVVADARYRAIMLTVIVLAGLGVAVENIWTERTQAAEVAAVINSHAHAGDIVAFCPDQLGPAVNRLLPSGRFATITYPRGTGPEFVNWVNYTAVAQASNPAKFALRLERMAGSNHQIWLINAPNYHGFGIKCQQLAGDLLDAPGYGGHQWVGANPNVYYEPMTLTQFAPPSAGHATG